jgi:hypothetical protein
MFGKIFGKDAPKVESLEDLQDDRARAIAQRQDLDVREILPRYLELQKEVMANGGQIEIDVDDPNTPLNVHDTYIRKLSCGAVLSYELSQRSAVKFPVAERAGLVGVGEDAVLASLKVKGVIQRTAPVQVYEQIGQVYEQVMQTLSAHQQSNLDRMLGE